MITWEAISKATEGMKTVPIKNKDYVQVPERVKAFRQICPGGSIYTDIVSMEGDIVVMKATITDEDGKILSTGMAFEDKNSSYINKTSYIENCETSAVGRALGFLAVGVDASMCSAEELVNALVNQNKPVKAQEEATPKAAPPQEKPNALVILEWCKAHKMSTEGFGNWRNIALAQGIIPDKRANELTPDELQNLIAFVEANDVRDA